VSIVTSKKYIFLCFINRSYFFLLYKGIRGGYCWKPMDSSGPKGYEKIISYCDEDHAEIGINSHSLLNYWGFTLSVCIGYRFCLPFRVKARGSYTSFFLGILLICIYNTVLLGWELVFLQNIICSHSMFSVPLFWISVVFSLLLFLCFLYSYVFPIPLFFNPLFQTGPYSVAKHYLFTLKRICTNSGFLYFSWKVWSRFTNGFVL
jgi:hypothetical protein